FRLGSLGTALFVVGVAVIATGMTWSGLGPIAEATSSRTVQTHLIQGFVAANFLTGLPVAAILAGRARIVQELETGKRQLDILADNISDAVLHYDLDGICTYASPSVRDVLGEPPARCIGARFSDNMHEDARERIMRAERQLLSGSSQNERFTYRRFRDSEDGTPVFIEAECAIVTNGRNGVRDGIVVAARDVTERVELELLLTRARRHAENAARAKSEFLANMSHEIRTPMNGVLGFAELMLQGELDPDQRRQTELIVQSGRSMMMLLNDVLDLSRIEAGQMVIDNAPVDLEATLAECTALHRPSAEKKGVDLQFELAPSDIASASDKRAGEGTHSKPWIMTDALRLRQIVLNLIGNAVKFTEHGRIEVTYRLVDSEFVVDVLDTGIGISPNRLETIFRPFTQGESDTARRFGGTGLGLSISRQLADLLGGKITVESEPGEGSRFTLTLPAIHARPEQRPLPPPEPISPEDLPHHARILLAEDHDVNRMLVREMLERCGQSVAIAHDGNEAISMVIDSIMRGSPYDLVLMDMQMPGCDGYAATRAIRAEGITPDILPIVALTANAFPEDIAAASDAGMQAHLAKPLVFADLARVLQRWLPTRIIEAEADQDTLDPSDVDEQGPDQSEVVDLLHAAREHNGSPLRPKANPKAHSPALIRRWITRREEAIEAVRAALANGILNSDSDNADAREALAKLVHKLAGTAGMFGEPELGDQAAAFESAVRMELDGKVQEAL
ncbi:MAG: ATP-binding protein, partial [Pseudomonadota bacterium]